MAVGLVLAAGWILWLTASCRDLGFARDEGFYFRAADRYAGWVARLVEDPGTAVERAAVEAAWRENHEHPPLMKTLFGLSHALLHERAGLFVEPSTAYRFPAILLAGLALAVLYWFGCALRGRITGLAAAILFALQPRDFYHAHLACFDMPVTVMILLVTWAYWRSLGAVHPHRWAVAAGALWGLALLTKINALFVPATLLLHYAVVWWRGRRGARRFPLVPRAHLAMLVVGPLLLVALWPWLWWDTFARIGSWVGFFRDHDYYTIEYLGVSYFRPPFPLSYAWGMLAFEVPLTTLVLVAVGIGLALRTLLPARTREHLGSLAGEPADDRVGAWLLLCSALVPILLVANGRSPIFGGSKHFMSAMPFLCLLAGIAAQTAFVAAARSLERVGRPAVALAAAALALCALPPWVDTRRSHPFGLSHYNVVAGGTPGAADLGLCRQFWGFTTGSLAPWLNRTVSRRGAVQFHDTTLEAVRMLQRDGRLRDDIRVASTAERAELALVHHEQHWAFLEYALWDTYRTAVPRHVLTHQGVPIVTVYGPSRRASLAGGTGPR